MNSHLQPPILPSPTMPISRTTCQHPNKHTIALLFAVTVFIANSSLAMLAEKGFSLELIHRDSVHSPLYPGNLTDTQRIERLVHFSNSRINWLKSLILENHEMALRSTIVYYENLYMVKLFIGTPQQEVFLHFDTGSKLVWTQCEPCHQCFPQNTPKFVPEASRTFSRLSSDHHLCEPPWRDRKMCKYHLTYGGRTAYTEGILATEHFVFESSSSSSSSSSGHHTENLVFGCSTRSSIAMYPENSGIGGIMGMSNSPLSFAQQLDKYTKGRFSYCLVPGSNRRSYLRFGEDIPEGRNAQTIPLLRVEQRTHYLVDLEDISINDRRLNLQPGTFAFNHNDNKGGCIFDSGTAVTHLIRPAFEALRKALVEHFDQHDFKPLPHAHAGLNLCFQKQARSAAPFIGFHFRGGATFRVPNQNSFEVFGSSLCLLMNPDNSVTMLGSMLQENFRVVYDIRERHITLFPENCNQE